MKVTLEKHGGLAAGMRQPPCVVESSTLAAKQQEELSGLVAALKAAPTVQHESPGRMRDAMTFTISVDDSRSPTVYQQLDLQMSDAFATLLTWIEKHSSASRL